jgi:hypothetical protein
MTSAAASPLMDFSSIAAAFADVADHVLSSGAASGISSSDVERVLTAAIKLYAVKAETEAPPPPPVSADKITPTEVVVVVSEMLRAVDLNLFDLSMWYRRAR